VTPGRDEQGRFRRGVSGNPKGRPAKEVEQDYHNAARSACTPEEWREIIACHKVRARRDVRSAQFLASVLGIEAAKQIEGDIVIRVVFGDASDS
jgi:hypothetical protein